ncbi:MAG: M28 family peptidase [Alkaliphilus sp.]
MNRAKKIIVLLTIILAFLVFTCGCTNQRDKSDISLNSERIREHLDVLVSDEFGGRMIGTEGNAKTISYIDNHFYEIGLVPAESGTFLTDFETVVPSLTTPITFKVHDQDGNVVAEYRQGEDFKTRFDSFSLGGEFSGKTHLITNHRELSDLENMFEGMAVLVDMTDETITANRFDSEEIIELLKIKRAEVIIYKETGALDMRDIRIGLKNTFIPVRGSVLLGVNEKIFNDLIAFFRMGYTVEVDSELTFSEIETHNILGMIPGTSRNRDNYIMIATSFDGLGLDEHGSIHRSIANNATAVATVLEIAETIKENKLTFDSTIVFAAFNGQHTGFVGIGDYQRNMIFPHDRTQVIVLENLVSNLDNPLIIGTFEREESTRKRSKLLVNRLVEIAEAEQTEHIKDFRCFISQHMAFRHMGTVAGVLTHGHVQEITVSDLSEVANISAMTGKIALKYVMEHANIKIFNDIIKPFMYMSPFIVLLILLFALKLYIRRDNESMLAKSINKRIFNSPIISTMSLFVVLGLAIVLQVRHNVAETTGVLYANVEISFALVLAHLLEIVPAVILLIYPFIVILVIIVVVTTIAMIVFAKKSVNTYAIITMIITYFSFLFVMMSIFRYDYLVVLPNVLSFNNAGIVVHTIITLISLLITFIWMAEKNRITGYDMTHIKVALCYTFIFLTITFITVAPFLSTDELFKLMQAGSRVRF